MEIEFRIWDEDHKCYRYPEPEDDVTVQLGSRYIWAPFFFNASSPVSSYKIEALINGNWEPITVGGTA